MNDKIKILVADSRIIFVTGLGDVLSKASNIKILSMCSSGEEAVLKASKLKPDIIIVGSNITECNCAEVITRIREQLPNVRIIVITHSKIESSEDPMSLLELRPDGYLADDIDSLHLIETINSINLGKRAISPAMGASILDAYYALRKQQTVTAQLKLTKREVEILSMVARGLTNRDISKIMFISSNTVKVHLSAIMKKFNVSNRWHAALIAKDKGIILDHTYNNLQ